MTLTFTTLRTVLAAAVLAVTAVGCAASDTSSSSDQAASSPGDKGTDPGDGSCQDILDHGCDGLSGDKLEGCKADIQNAFDECVKVEACTAVRDGILKGCEPKDEACIAKADAAFAECIGPADNTQPGK